MQYEIQQIDGRTAPESLLRELASYYEIVEREDMPDDPPTPADVMIADWRNMTSEQPVARWLLRDDDGIAAAAVAVYNTKQNLENGFARLHVHPDKRGRGYARAIAVPMLELLESEGRTRLHTWVKEGEPAEQLLAALGLKKVYHERRSRLRVADLDHELMRAWSDRARDRAGDYEVQYYQSPLPDEIVEKFCQLAFIMNTAPLEDYEEEDEVLTPETWREMEQNEAEAKNQLHTLIAVHKPTGDFAGYTQIKTQDLQPEVGWQWDTGVDPAHRNKGLGRWLKADMIERIVAEYPLLEKVDTYNADSNEPMLNINIEMGFRPIHISNTWQGPLSTVRERFRA